VQLGTLWVQTAAEYEGLTEQAFGMAGDRLAAALADPTWTAAVEQVGTAYADLPPAIIADVDETILDNSPLEARLAVEGIPYSEAVWKEWVELRAAKALPGAKAFLERAHQQGVTIFYVTNRSAEQEEATRDNLKSEGLPLDGSEDRVLTKGENDWGSDKITRRQAVAKTHRILLLLGDDLNDFVSGARAQEPETRIELARQHADKWGRRWILLPNPIYGSWEASLYGRDYGLPVEEKLRLKRGYLRPPT
jgi:acid phosphatase